MTIDPKKKPRTNDRAKKFNPKPGTASSSGPFKTSLADELGSDMLGKLRKHLEDQQNRKIREAMNDPKVKKASEAFAKKA
jgi:hypothetical protein